MRQTPARDAGSWWRSGLHLLVIASLSALAAGGLTGWRLVLFLILAVTSGGTALVRERYPYALLFVAWAVTAFATQILLIPALFVLGVRGRGRRGLAALALTVVLVAVVAPRGERFVSVDGVDLQAWSLLGSWVLDVIAVVVVPYLVGRGVAARRELVESYRLRAEYAESERSARAAEAVLLERARIAREAPAVRGHKVSFLAM